MGGEPMITIEYAYITGGPKIFRSEAPIIIIGRSSGERVVDLDLSPDSTVSRQHARLVYENEAYWLEDLKSRGGTWLNDQKIVTKIKVQSGDQIRIGQTALRVNTETVSSFKRTITETQPIRI